MAQYNSMIHYIRLIRPLNVAVVALTMLLFRYCIIDVENYRMYDFLPYMNTLSFYILLVTTMLITAGGYVINDIYDVETDQINKPDKLIVGKHIEDKDAFNYYLILTGLGIIGSFALMYTTKQMKISMLPIIVAVLLYLYASTFKKMMLLGNVVVAMCAALPIILLSIYELRINQFDTAVIVLFTQGIGLSALVYATFAFLTTLIREIIKDVEDMEGDDVIGARTFPIVAGINASKALIVLTQLITLTIILLITYYFLVFKLSFAFYGIVLMMLLPLLVQIGLVIRAKTPEQFKWASLTGKIHMVTGVLTLLFFYSGTAPYIFNQMFNFVSQLLNII